MRCKYQKMYWIMYSLIFIYAVLRIYFKIDHAVRTPIAQIYTISSYIITFVAEIGILEILLSIFSLTPEKIGTRIIRQYPEIDQSQTLYDPTTTFEKEHKKIMNVLMIILIVIGLTYFWFRYTHQYQLEVYIGTLFNLILWFAFPFIFFPNGKKQYLFYKKMDNLIEEQEYKKLFQV